MAFLAVVGRVPCVTRARAVIGRSSLRRRLQEPGSNGSSFFETSGEGSRIEVPLSANVGVIAGCAEGLAPQVDVLEAVFDVERAQSAVQHHAAGNADGASPSALVEAVGEGAAFSNQTIEVRGVNFRVVQAVDRAIHEVIGDDEQEVGLFAFGLNFGSRSWRRGMEDRGDAGGSDS